MADLGIEFESKGSEKSESKIENRHPDKVNNSQPVAEKTKFVPKSLPMKNKENTALKEVLKKITADGGTSQKAVVSEPATAASGASPQAAISLDDLKNKNKEIASSTVKDRAASAEDMNKLKNLIITKTSEPKKEEITTPAKATPPPQRGEETLPAKEVAEPPLTSGNIKEVPEDVLKKILE